MGGSWKGSAKCGRRHFRFSSQSPRANRLRPNRLACYSRARQARLPPALSNWMAPDRSLPLPGGGTRTPSPRCWLCCPSKRSSPCRATGCIPALAVAGFSSIRREAASGAGAACAPAATARRCRATEVMPMPRPGLGTSLAAGRTDAGASLRKTGLAKTIDEMLERSGVAEWLGRRPVMGCEMRVADEEQLGLRARFFEPAELGQACGQETA